MIRPTRLVGALFFTLGILSQPGPAWSIALDQIDDFQDGTTQGWGSGAPNPNPPSVIFDAGPGGVGDDALLVSAAGGFGPGSRLVVFNTTQWAGDYLTEGVEMIVADVNNVGSTALSLRVAFEGPGGRFASTVAVPLGAGSGWLTVAFPVSALDLTSVGGLDVNSTLGGVTQLRVISAAVPSFMGDPVASQILVDNVEALPEPSEIVLLCSGFLALWTLARLRASAYPLRPARMPVQRRA